MADQPRNLFVYGSLMNPSTFRAVTGMTFDPPAMGYAYAQLPARADQPTLEAVEAILPDYDLSSPDQLYYYALPHAGRRVHGFLIHGVPADAMEEIVQYEGDQYECRDVQVMTEAGPADAVSFVGARGRLQSRFGTGYRRALKAELAFRARVDRFFQNKAARAYGDVASEPSYTRAIKELKGATIHDLVQAHFQTEGLSDFFVGQALAGPVRSIEPLRSDEDAALFADAYLRFLLRQVLLNQFETRVREQFRYEIDRLRGSDRYYEHTISSLVALRMLTASPELVEMVIGDALSDLDYRRKDLIDYVEWAVIASDQIFEPDAARMALEWIDGHLVDGVLPLGAELELSNLPHHLASPEAEIENAFDPTFASFRYFEQFALDAVSWKLGGHVERRNVGKSRLGSLVFSLGSVGKGIEASNPISDDPWIVSQIIQHVLQFYEVTPHALRISIQVPRAMAPKRGQLLDEATIRCLLALGGDAGPGEDGRTRVRRIANREILYHQPKRELDVLRIARRKRRAAPDQLEATGVTELADAGQAVAQYRFIRLAKGVNYEPLILALKGVQLHYRPGDCLTSRQMQANKELGAMFDRLADWGDNPTPIPQADIDTFLDAVRAGLKSERLGRSPHSPTYLNWAIRELSASLAEFNDSVSQ